ncbi:hypothetical protein LAZ67_3000392 [Cordylochernes scorpioides]|uniref:Endonuclease/exonuclease/phosphatase domain-containing protein n=1 Tax=Cordylochernes scorpioides TaxID=51811 RepID=A0ABY6K6Y9_9ARAC|nr:hypothetical protein LAZ67_3000392 [Cordylochernes scorpioides]
MRILPHLSVSPDRSTIVLDWFSYIPAFSMIHHDNATSHTSSSTQTYLEDLRQRTGINTIPKNRTPVKSSDLAPMDFCIFGCLKRALGKRHPRTIEGVWKVAKEEWDLLSMTMIRKCLLSWKISFLASFANSSAISLPRSQHGQESIVECSYSPMIPVGDGWLRHKSRALQIAVSLQVKFDEICPAPSLILMFVPSCSIMLIPAPPLLRVRSEDPSVYAVKGRGLAFLIKNLYYEDIAVNITNTLDLEAQGIKVYLNQNKAINIYNMYHPPNNTFIDDGTMAQFLTDNTIIVGDLNAKHQLWGCPTPNPRGKILSNIFDDNAFMCLNDGNPTHHSYKL